MKLRNLLLTVLVLGAGTAFAGNDNAPGQLKKIIETIGLQAHDSYTWNVEQVDGKTASSVLNITMIRMNANETNVETGWRYKVSGYGKNETDHWEQYLSNTNGTPAGSPDYASIFPLVSDDNPNGLTQKQIDALTAYAPNHGVFNFQVSFDNPVETFSLVGLVNKTVDSIDNTTEHKNDNKFYSVGGTNVLYWGSDNLEPNNGALFIVSLNTTYTDNPVETKGGPLPAPVMTLLIALGFGALLVYRRKQAKA